MPAIVAILIGLALLVLLAFAVAYATGFGSRPAGTGEAAPTAEGELPPGVGAERKTQVAMAMILTIGVVMLLYGLNEPQRQAAAIERQRETAMERGARLYAQYCFGCHGYNGQGAIVPGQEVLAANLALRAATGDRDEDRKLFDFLTKTIARGRPNTPMPAWGLQDGGSLNDEEIAELATWIMYAGPRWNEIQALVAPGAPTPIVPTGGEGPDAVARGLFLSKGCGACHTVQGLAGATGTVGPNLSQLGTVAGTRKPGMSAADYIRESITQPNAFIVPGFPSPSPMPPFTVTTAPQSGAGQLTETELQALIDWLSKLGT